MNKQGRNESGKFAAKSNENRQVRSIRLTDSVWDTLGKIADERSITRADLVENWMDREYFDLEEKAKQLELELENIRSSSIQVSVDVLGNLDKIANEQSITREELIIDLLNSQKLDVTLVNSKESTQLDLLSDSVPKVHASINSLNNTDLAKRLGVDGSNLRKTRLRKNYDEFLTYTVFRDPDNVALVYSEVDKLYHPVCE